MLKKRNSNIIEDAKLLEEHYMFSRFNAIELACMIADLCYRLECGEICQFMYKKADDTFRFAQGSAVQTKSGHLVKYYDMFVNDWRCFNKSRLVYVK